MEKTLKWMQAAYLPGNSTVELKEVMVPEPGHGQVLIKTKSSTICGSDIRAIYREHLGKGPEAYQNKIDNGLKLFGKYYQGTLRQTGSNVA